MMTATHSIPFQLVITVVALIKYWPTDKVIIELLLLLPDNCGLQKCRVLMGFTAMWTRQKSILSKHVTCSVKRKSQVFRTYAGYFIMKRGRFNVSILTHRYGGTGNFIKSGSKLQFQSLVNPLTYWSNPT